MTDFVSDHKCFAFDASVLPITITRNVQSALASFMSSLQLIFQLANCLPHFANINGQVCWFNEVSTSVLDASTPYTSRAFQLINTAPWSNNVRQHRREYKKVDGKNQNFEIQHL